MVKLLENFNQDPEWAEAIAAEQRKQQLLFDNEMSQAMNVLGNPPLRMISRTGFVLLLAAGCGQSGPDVGTVEGVVKLDGKPIPGVLLTFRPSEAGGTPSYGGTDHNGYYKLMFTSSKAGALLGSHTVEITTPKHSKSEIEELKASGEEVPAESISLPKKYKDPAALTAEVKSGHNNIDFTLSSAP